MNSYSQPTQNNKKVNTVLLHCGRMDLIIMAAYQTHTHTAAAWCKRFIRKQVQNFVLDKSLHHGFVVFIFFSSVFTSFSKERKRDYIFLLLVVTEVPISNHHINFTILNTFLTIVFPATTDFYLLHWSRRLLFLIFFPTFILLSSSGLI